MENLFTIGQAVKSCSVSRSTILRMEERGLIKADFVDKNTGYRYYDTFSISKILQIKNYLNMGMSYDDIQKYYTSGGSSEDFMKGVENRLLALKRVYEEMKLRAEKEEEIICEFITLPQYICYTRESKGATLHDRYKDMYELFHYSIERGYKPLPSEPLFVINKRTDFLESKFSEELNCDYICCVPLEPEGAPEEAVVYPSCKALSCLFYGDYRKRIEAHNELGRKIRELGLKPTGYPRALGLVAPYTGREIGNDNYVTRIVVPIEEFPKAQK